MDLAQKAILAGRYRLERPLGAGAMGEVWEATQLAIGTRVAVKRLSAAGAASHEMVTRFKREAQMLGRVRSDYVARLLDFVEDKTYGFILVMELVEGRSLLEVLVERRLSAREAVDLGCDILAALADLHAAHVIHRDLKPGNLIVRPERRGGTRTILVDFGMSRLQHHGDKDDEITDITRAGVALGTLSYMAPEQMLSSRDVKATADLYAAGAILFRAVAGRHAYVGEDETTLAQKKLTEEAEPMPTLDEPVSRALADVVARALRRRPAQRFASAEEMLAALECLRTGTPMFDEDTTTHQSAPVLLAAPRSRVTESGALPLPPETSADPVSLHASPGGSRSYPAAPLPEPTPKSPPRRAVVSVLVVASAVAIVGGAVLVRQSADERLSAASRPPSAVLDRAPAPASASASVSASVSAPVPVPAAPPSASASADVSVEALPGLEHPEPGAPRAVVSGPLRPRSAPSAVSSAPGSPDGF